MVIYNLIEYNAHAVKYVKAYGLKDAKGVIKDINVQINKDFGLAGPLTLSSTSAKIHSVRWVLARESFVVQTKVKRVTKETVAAAVAQINKCPYCEDVHGASIQSAGGHLTTKAFADGTWESLTDQKLKSIIHWSLNTRNPEADIIKNPPFTADEAPEIIGTALNFHSTNRLVSVFLDESPLPGILKNKLIKKAALHYASKTLFKSMVEKKANPGDSLKFIGHYSVSNSSKWALPVPAYAAALAAEEHLLKEMELGSIPENITSTFKEFVSNWNGESMPLGRSWLKEVVKPIPEMEKPLANLMFLSAFTPYTITETDINLFRSVKPSDHELIEFSFWAIQTLTNRIAKWLTEPFK